MRSVNLFARVYRDSVKYWLGNEIDERSLSWRVIFLLFDADENNFAPLGGSLGVCWSLFWTPLMRLSNQRSCFFYLVGQVSGSQKYIKSPLASNNKTKAWYAMGKEGRKLDPLLVRRRLFSIIYIMGRQNSLCISFQVDYCAEYVAGVSNRHHQHRPWAAFRAFLISLHACVCCDRDHFYYYIFRILYI